MTTIAIARMRPRPWSESWKACAVPWKVAVIVAGMVAAPWI
jgi:hypothetical protein